MNTELLRELGDAHESADTPELDVAADLTLAREGNQIQIESTTQRVFVTLPSVGVGIRVALGLLRRDGLFDEITDMLSGAGLTVVVRVGGIDVAILGASAEPGRFGRLVGHNVELRLGGMALALADGVV